MKEEITVFIEMLKILVLIVGGISLTLNGLFYMIIPKLSPGRFLFNTIFLVSVTYISFNAEKTAAWIEKHVTLPTFGLLYFYVFVLISVLMVNLLSFKSSGKRI